MGLPQELADFEGKWHISRQIKDRIGQDGSFEGEAHFVPKHAGLRYQESGFLTSGGQSFAATRVYLWREDKAGITVLFEDGRPFHRFVLGRSASAGHDCAPDRYDVSYDFRRWPNWSTLWQVHGPRKDYRMETNYKRF